MLKVFCDQPDMSWWWDSQVVITDQEQGGLVLFQDLVITIIEFSLLRVRPGCWDLSLTSEHTAQSQMMMSQSFVNFHMSLWSAGTWSWSGGKLFEFCQYLLLRETVTTLSDWDWFSLKIKQDWSDLVVTNNCFCQLSAQAWLVECRKGWENLNQK